MTIPPLLQTLLKPGEDLLWHSPAAASDRLSDYGGPHELIARLFLGLSAIMAVIFFLGMQDAGKMGVSLPLLVYVGGPVVIGLAIRQIGRRRGRRVAQSTYYGVTSHRILMVNGLKQEVFHIEASTLSDIAFSGQDRDLLEYTSVGSGNVPAKRMMLPKGEAEKAQRVINLVKASL